MELPFDSVTLILGIYPKNPETIQMNIWTPMFIAVLFPLANIWKQPKYTSVDE